MPKVKDWLEAASDVSISLQSTFNGALQQYAFASSNTKVDLSLEQSSPTPVRKRKAANDPSPRLKRRSPRSPGSNPLLGVTSPQKLESPTKLSLSPKSARPKPKRPSSGYAPPSKYAHLGNALTDSLAPSLICVFIGVNPGLQTATSGHAYAHPSNLFWKLLHSSGCTTRRCAPSEDHDMPHLFSLGLTNIVTRPTRDASELSKAEMDAGVPVLEEKVAQYRPDSVCIVGKGIWESVFRARHGRNMRKEEFKYGWQDDEVHMGMVKGEEDPWPGARIFVATTTSGLAAGMRPAEKEAVWRVLGQFVERRRLEKGTQANAVESQISCPVPGAEPVEVTPTITNVADVND